MFVLGIERYRNSCLGVAVQFVMERKPKKPCELIKLGLMNFKRAKLNLPFFLSQKKLH